MASTWGTVLYKWFTLIKENVNFCVPLLWTIDRRMTPPNLSV